MGVRKTESRLPVGFQAADLGEAVTSSDGRCSLISFISAPLAVSRPNTYVVIVGDNALASAIESFEWSFTEDVGPPVIKTTAAGQTDYLPLSEGYLQVTVRMLGAGSAEQASLSLIQQIGSLNAALEAMIEEAISKPGAAIGNADVLRELVNDHNPYYMNVSLNTPETGDGFKRLVFSTIHDAVLTSGPGKRSSQLEQISDSLNTGQTEFVSAAAPRLGVAGVRLVLVAMLLPPTTVALTELPEPGPKNAFADQELREKVAALSEAERIDLFNMVRFPKSNITVSGKLLEALRDKFFSGVPFDEVLTKLGGKMADWLTLNYQKGPLTRT